MADKDIIIIENEVIKLDHNVSTQLAYMEREVKRMKELEENIKSAILKEMEARGIYKIDTPDVTITYVAPSERETFDSKTFKVENAKLYHQYLKTSEVKSSVRIKVKE